MRRRHLSVLVVLLVIACEASPPSPAPEPEPPPTATADSEPPPSPSTTTVVVARAGVETALTRFLPVGVQASRGPDGNLDFVACRWRAPGMFSFDLSWVPDGDVDWPITLPLGLGFTHGDVGGGQWAEVNLDHPGDFTVAVDIYDPAGAWAVIDSPIRAGRGGPAIDQPSSCMVWTLADNLVAEPSIDPVPPQLPTVRGGLEELLASIDPTDTDHPLLPLVYLFAHPGLPAIDRLYLVGGLALESASVETRGPCVVVSLDYATGDGPELVLQQTIRCEAGYPGTFGHAVEIDDDVWNVVLFGAEADVAAHLHSVEMTRVMGVDELGVEDAAFDADALIDAQVVGGERGVEIARLDWAGGRVAVMRLPGGSGWGDTYSDPVVATPVTFNGGLAGMDCRDYSLVVVSDSTRGFLLAVTRDAGYSITFGSGAEARQVHLQPAAGGRQVGLIDLPGVEVLGFEEVSVTDANGQTVPCVQE